MLTISGLKKSYNGTPVLKGIDAVINKGDVVTLIGPSGMGKSTLLRCINRLETPDEGEIEFEGKLITSMDKNELCALRRQIGMVFQSFNLFSHLTVAENITLGMTRLLKTPKAEAQEAVTFLLNTVGLPEKAEAYPDELSGGQKQRIAIARCLAMKPEILLFDEPTSALDPAMVGEVTSVIQKLTEMDLTMLIVTHEMEFAKNVSSRVFYMDEGTIYEEGPPEVIFDAPRKEKTRAFMGCV